MVNILLISHSKPLAQATFDFLKEMKQKDFKLDFVGGTDHGSKFGSDPMEIVEKYKELLSDGKEVLVVYDLGSSLLNAQNALELLENPEDKNKIQFANVAFVEGGLAAVCSNNEGTTAAQLKETVERQCKINK